MSKKKKKRIRRGILRALITLAVLALGLFALNCGWDWLRGHRFLSFARDRWLLGADIVIAVCASIAAYMSAFKNNSRKKAKENNLRTE